MFQFQMAIDGKNFKLNHKLIVMRIMNCPIKNHLQRNKYIAFEQNSKYRMTI